MINLVQNFHRLLSGAPFLAAAVAAIFATAFPEQTARLFWQFNNALVVPRIRYACLAGLVFYFIAWWVSSLPPKTARKRNQTYLRSAQQTLKDLQQKLIASASQTDFEAHLPMLQVEIDSIKKWIDGNMSAEAALRFENPARQARGFNFVGQSSSDPNFHNYRQSILQLNADRIAELDVFVGNDGWDK